MFHTLKKLNFVQLKGRTSIERVLDMFDYTSVLPGRVAEKFGPKSTVLSEEYGGREIQLFARPQTDRLEMRRVEVNGTMHLADDERFSIFLVLEGNGILICGNTILNLKKWDKLLIPSSCDSITLDGELTIARCMPPKP